MMRSALPLLLLLLMLSACSASKRTAGNSASGTMTTIPASTPKSTDDGLSYTTAIIITEKTETTGVRAEYNWIKQHYENYTVKGQALNYHEKSRSMSSPSHYPMVEIFRCILTSLTTSGSFSTGGDYNCPA